MVKKKVFPSYHVKILGETNINEIVKFAAQTLSIAASSTSEHIEYCRRTSEIIHFESLPTIASLKIN